MAQSEKGKDVTSSPPRMDRSEQSASPEQPQDSTRIDRRSALRQIGAVSAIAAGAGWTALAPSTWPGSLRDPDGERGKPTQPTFRLPEHGFRVPDAPGLAVLGIARGQDVVAMLKAAVDAIGGVGRFIQKGDVVVVKPNVAFERAAPLGATSNPDVLKALVRLVLDAGAKEVRVADNPIESPESCFVRSGIQRATLESGARLYLPKKSDFQTVHVPGAKWIEHWPFFWQPFRDATKVIGLAPVKDHNLCRASMTTKNWYGLLGGRRNQFHQDIHGIITDLALMMRPTFVVLDGTRVLFRSGPTGGSLEDVRAGQTIVAATDSLAADAFGWQDLLGRGDESLPAYFEQVAQKNLGNPDWRSLPFKETQIG